MSPDEFARQLEQMGSQFERSASVAITETLEAAKELAQRYSSGPLSQAELAALDHPFARRHGTPQLDPSIVNVETGRFRDSWEMEGPNEQGGGMHGALWNSSPEAVFLETGTRYMFERPIADRVQVEIEPVFQANVERQLTLLLR